MPTRPLTTVLRLGTSAPLEHYEQVSTPDAVLPAGTSDVGLAEAFPWELAECLSGHHAACVLLGHGFSPWPAASVLAAAMHALLSAAERAQHECIVRLRLSLVQILEDDKLADLLPGASDPSAPRLAMREGRRGSRIIGAVQRTVRGADEVQQLVQSALHSEGRPRAHATVAQLLVESHPRFGGGEVACGCVTVADVSGWDLARPGDALQASSMRSATDGAAAGANRALHALAGCVDALAASSRRSAAVRHTAAAGPTLQVPWRSSKLTRLLRDQLLALDQPAASASAAASAAAAAAASSTSASLTLACSLCAPRTNGPAVPPPHALLLMVERAAAAAAAARLAAAPASVPEGGRPARSAAPADSAAGAAAGAALLSLRWLHDAVTTQEELLRAVHRLAPEAVRRPKHGPGDAQPATLCTQPATLCTQPATLCTHPATLTRWSAPRR